MRASSDPRVGSVQPAVMSSIHFVAFSNEIKPQPEIQRGYGGAHQYIVEKFNQT